MTTIYLIRHAEAEGNLYRRAQGHQNSTITDRGYRQIAALAKRFAGVHIDAVYSSDLARTCTTAKSVTLSHHLPLHKMPELREICVGAWEDMTWAEIAYFDKEGLVTFNSNIGEWQCEGGEPVTAVRDRMLKAIRAIITAHPNQTVAVFSHGMALRTLIGTLQGLSIHEIDKTGHAENTAVTKLECDDADNIRVIFRDDASHLTDELSTLRKQAWTKNSGGLEAGIYYKPSGEKGHFDVMRESEAIGSVSVGKCENGIAEIGEFSLKSTEQHKGIGIQLVGQAVSYARSQGCDTLQCTILKSNCVGCKRAAQYGFVPVLETAKFTRFEKYFGYAEQYQVQKIQEAIKNS